MHSKLIIKQIIKIINNLINKLFKMKENMHPKIKINMNRTIRYFKKNKISFI
jgi:hypothetical protein